MLYDRRQFSTATVLGTGAALAARLAPAAEARPVTLALLGVAHIHVPMFLQVLQSRDDVKIAWVWDREGSRAAKVAAGCGARVAPSAAAALDDPAVAGVVILSETSLHAELAIGAAKAGKALFVEKPLAATAADADAIAQAVEKAGVPFTVGYHLRTEPKRLFVKENLVKGHFGKVVRAQASIANDCVLQGAFDDELHWTVEKRFGGLGAFADIGTHVLDLLVWLFGDVERVAADLAPGTGRYGQADEVGQALLRFANGVTATLAASWIEPQDPVSLLISGTEGHAALLNDRLHLRTKKVAGADGARPWGKLPPGPDHPLLQFVAAAAGQKGLPLVGVAEAAQRVRLMEAIYQAAAERRWIDCRRA